MMHQRESVAEIGVQSQRDCDLQPKVGAQRLPWVNIANLTNPNGVVANLTRTDKTEWPQPRCGWEFFADVDPG